MLMRLCLKNSINTNVSCNVIRDHSAFEYMFNPNLFLMVFQHGPNDAILRQPLPRGQPAVGPRHVLGGVQGNEGDERDVTQERRREQTWLS